jgi:hypothetical protein
LKQNQAAEFEAYRVTSQVNSSKYAGDDCIVPVAHGDD